MITADFSDPFSADTLIVSPPLTGTAMMPSDPVTAVWR